MVTALDSIIEIVEHEYLDRVRKKFPDVEEMEFRAQLLELCKFLYIASTSSHLPFYASRQLDLIWHELILETQDYAKLCKKFPGGRFLHHRGASSDERSREPGSSSVVREISAYVAYIKYFGDFSAQRLSDWPRLELLMKSWGLESVDALNQKLREILERP